MTRSRLFVSRRKLMTGAAYGLSGLVLGGCDRLSSSEKARSWLDTAEDLNFHAQRLLAGSQSLAREFAEADISRAFRANGSTNPDDPAYQAHAQNGFADWRLQIGGLVARAREYSLADLRALPSRTQITRHDCVEGWSCIGKWKGTPLSAVLRDAGLQPQARYIVFHCADNLDGEARYYESIDLVDAFHPQTILAYEMNGAPLPVPHGAPLRLRVERQLGYKMAKYVMRIEAVAGLERIQGGKGGYWEDRGYEWYAGI